MNLADRLRSLLQDGSLDLPLPGSGATAERHRALFELARSDVSVARLAEAHTDAIAILAEAGHQATRDCLYGVWASESYTHPLKRNANGTLEGSKAFCSGVDIVDRALITVRCPEPLLIDLDLRSSPDRIRFDTAAWSPAAFAETGTGTVSFDRVPVSESDIVGEPNWYLSRPGFWNGACGPAACWAGGAAGLLDYAKRHPRESPHDVAHLGAIWSAVWACEACLDRAGHDIDANPSDFKQAQVRALALRQTIEQHCSSILGHFGRGYGPRALAFEPDLSRRYGEVELYIRQCHAERDLEALGRLTAE